MMKILPLKVTFVLILTSILPRGSLGQQQDNDAARRGQAEAEFQSRLSGATLVGQYTISRDESATQEASDPLRPERYSISKVAKLQDDYWLFQARIKYGEHDVSLPLTLKVKWAGDTPVITLDDFPVPGLGTYSARVMFFRDYYAGTWSGKEDGGHLFGRIQPREVATQADDPRR